MRSQHATIGERILGAASVRAGYRVVLAEDADGVRQAQRLRFEVFNLELGV